MALVSVKDFGSALNISGGTIRSKKSRGQIRCNSKGLIDTENPINYIYLLEVNGGNQEVFVPFDLKPKTNVQIKVTTTIQNLEKKINENKIEKKKAVIVPKTVFKEVNDSKGSVNIAPTVETKNTESKKQTKIDFASVEKLTPEERKQKREDEKTRRELLDYDMRLKKATAEGKERETELRTMQLEKIAGNTIPLDKVISLMAINYKAIFKSFHSQLKNIASTTVQNLGGSSDDLHLIMKELEQVLNHIIEKSKQKSNLDVERLVEEYSEVRARGERK